MLAADVSLVNFYSDGTEWKVDYSITGTAQPFDIAVFRSADGVNPDGPAIQTTLTVSTNLEAGSYTLPVTPDFTDSESDYFLIARIEPSVGDTTSGSELFAGGTFVSGSVVHVHGTGTADSIDVASSSTLNVTYNGSPAVPLINGNVTEVHVRAHAGNDSMTFHSGVTQTVWAFGGADHDTYSPAVTNSSGSAKIFEVAGNGIDTLDFSDSTVGVSVNLWKTTAQSLGLYSLSLSDPAGIENVIGTDYADTLTGNWLGNSLDGQAGNDVLDGGPLATATVVGRHVFYNQSGTGGSIVRYDGNDAAINALDDNAIAPDKTAYLPGSGPATFANVTSFSKGINGIMIDIAGSHGAISAHDFLFYVGNNNTPSSWAAAPVPPSVSVRTGAGVSGSDRVEIIWANGAIQKQWLQVVTLAGGNTGLGQHPDLPAGQADVFYFGNAVGDSGLGDTATLATVNATDELGARNNPASILSNIPITNLYDYNRDAGVNATDELIARNNGTGVSTATRFLNIGVGSPPAPPIDTLAGGAGDDNLYAGPGGAAVDGGSGHDTLSVNAVDQPVTVNNLMVTAGAATVNYTDIESLAVTSSQGAFTINRPTGTNLPAAIALNSSSASPAVAINTGSEDDIVNFEGSQAVLARSGAADTTLVTVSSSPFNMTVNTNGGNDFITAVMSAALSRFVANGGDGTNDTLAIRDPAGKLGQFQYLSPAAYNGTLFGDYHQIEHYRFDEEGAGSPLTFFRVDPVVAWALSGSTLSGPLPFDISLAGTQAMSLNLSTLAGNDTFTYTALEPGTEPSSLTAIDVYGFTSNTVTILGSADDDVFEINGNAVRVNGGPLINISGVGTLSLQGGAGDDTFHVRALGSGIDVNFDDSSGAADSVDFSGIHLAGLALPVMTGIEVLNLSHASLSTVPAIPDSVTTLDLRYNDLDLSDPLELNPVSSHSALRELWLYGNPSLAGAPDLKGIAGMVLRVDLVPLGLEKAEFAADLPTALSGIVKALHYLPLEIYDYVLNNYAYQHYFGLTKGSLGTIRTRAGNDFDLSQLLIDLLKEASPTLDAQIVGTFWNRALPNQPGGLAIPIGDAMQWLGVTNLDAALAILNGAGPNPPTAGGEQAYLVPTEGTATHIVTSHVWVAASLPGFANAQLDPSWKLPELSSNARRFLDKYNADQNPPSNFQSVGELYLALNPTRSFAVNHLASYNPFTTNPFYDLNPLADNPDRKQVAYEWFEDQLSKWLAVNAPGLTLADLKYDRILRPTYTSRDSVPLTVASGEFWGGSARSLAPLEEINTSLPGTLSNVTKRVKVSVSNGPQTEVRYFAIPDISQGSLTVRWPSSNQIQLFQDETPIAGTAMLVGATEDYTVTFGFTSFAFTSPPFGTPPQFKNYLENPILNSKSYKRGYGVVTAIGIEANQISEQLIAAQQKIVNQDAIAVLSTGNVASFTSAHIAHLLALSVNKFFRRTDEGQDALDAIFHTVQVREGTAGGTASADREIDVSNLHPELQIPIVPTDLFVDVQQGQASAVSADGNADVEAKRYGLAVASSSSQESALWEELMNLDSMSTVKSFQWAKSQGIAIESITPSQWPAKQVIFQSTTFSTDPTLRSRVINSIQQSFNAGATTIVVPTRETPINDWHGVGYYAEFPQAQGWIIVGSNVEGSGGASGNQVASFDIPNSLPGQTYSGDPVNVANGGLVDDVVDISIPNLSIPFVFARHYDSTLPGDGTLGKGWYGSFSDKLTIPAGTNPDVTWTDEKGHEITFTAPAGSGTIFSLTGENANLITGVELSKMVDGGYSLRDTNGIARQYSSAGVLLKVVDLHGNALTVNRDENGRVSSVVSNTPHSPAPALAFAYDANNHLASITSGDGRVWRFTVAVGGGAPLLTEVESPSVPYFTFMAGTVLQYEYDIDPEHSATPLANLMTAQTTSNRVYTGGGTTTTFPGSRAEHSYYANGRVFQTNNPDGSVQTFQYNTYRGRTTFTDERGNNTSYDFDDKGRQTRLTQPDRTAEKDIWVNGLRSVHTDAFGVSTHFIYDALGNVTRTEKSAEDPATLGLSWPSASLLTIDDVNASGQSVPVLYQTNLTYDTRRDASGALLFSKVEDVELPSAVADARNTHNVYNATGDLTESLKTLYDVVSGTTTTLTTRYDYYPGRGELRSVTDARGDALATTYTTTFGGYNGFGKPTTVSRWVAADSSHGPTTTNETYHYDAFGNIDQYTDANGNITLYDYDALGRLRTTTQPAVEAGTPTTTRAYDERGNLRRVVDANGRATIYVYDARNRLVETTLADGSIVQTTYDGQGNEIAKTDGLGRVTRFRLDTRGRILQVVLPDGSSTSAFYNGVGQVLASADGNGNVSAFEYDRFGRLVSVLEPDLSTSTDGKVWSYKYDAMGNRIEQTLIVPGDNRTTTFAYDSLNRLVKRTDPAPGSNQKTPVWTYTYDAVGNQLSATLSALEGGFAAQVTTNAYDGLNHLVHQVRADNSNWDDTYDAAGNLKISSDGRGIKTQFNYDALGRLSDKTVNYDTIDAARQDSPQTAYQYDKVGNLTSYTLQQSGATPQWKTSYTYDALNRRTSETRFDSNLTTVLATSSTEYDAAGNVVLAIDPRGHLTRFAYDARNRNTKVVNALAGVSTTTFDPVGNVLTTTDELGNVTQHFYDRANREITTTYAAPVTGANPLVKKFVYDAQTGDLMTTYLGTSNPDLNQTRRTDYTFDKLHRLIVTTDPPAAPGGARLTTASSYDVAGNRITSTDEAGLVTSYEYDGLGRLTRQIDPDPDGAGGGIGRNLVYDYDENGNLALSKLESATAAVLEHTEYAYDNANRQIATKRFAVNTVGGFTAGQLYSTSTSKYDAAGNLTSTTDPLGRSAQYMYDGAGRVTETRRLDANQNVLSDVVNAYDPAGNLASSTDRFSAVASGAYTTADDRTTTYQVDALDRRTRVSDPLFHATMTVYDAVGNIVSVVDPLGNVTAYEYDAQGRRTKVIDAENRVTTTSYNEVGNVKYVQDASNQRTNYVYNDLDQLTKEVLDDAQTGLSLFERSYEYDVRGHLARATDRNGRVREFVFDAYGRQTQETWLDAAELVIEQLESTFAPDDQMTSASSTSVPSNRQADSSYTYNYTGDPIRRLNSMWILQPAQAYAFERSSVGLTKTYDQADQLTREVVTTFDNGSNFGLTDYTLNYKYDGLGNVTQVNQRNGTDLIYTVFSTLGATFSWNPAGQLLTTQRYKYFDAANDPLPGSANNLGSDSYSYDHAGRLTGLAELAGYVSGFGVQRVYELSYDATGRIVRNSVVNTTRDASVSTGNTVSTDYRYDKTDQLTRADHNDTADESYAYSEIGNRVNHTVQPNLHARVVGDGTFTYTYDNEGNLVTKTRIGNGSQADFQTKYFWDHRNRLVEVQQFAGNGAGGPSTTNTLDEHYVYDAFDQRIAVWRTDELQLTLYAYDNGQVIQQQSSNLNYCGIPTARYLPGPQGQPIAEDFGYYDVGTETYHPGNVRWLLADQQGSITAVVDFEGHDRGEITYDSFGRVTSATTPAAAGSLFGYAGGVYDATTGLDYFRARYYDSFTGRWLSEDPIGFAAGDTNLYRYVGNNPVNATDPTGLSTSYLGNANSYGNAFFADPGASSPWDFNNWGAMPGTISPLNPLYNDDFGGRPGPDTLGPWLGDNTRNYITNNYRPDQVLPRVLGAAQAVGGTVETVASGTLAIASAPLVPAGVGIPSFLLGTAGTAHGVDTTWSGLQTVWSGEPSRTFTSQALDRVTGSPTVSGIVDAGLNLGFTLGSAALIPRVAPVPAQVSAASNVLRWDPTHPLIEGVLDAPRSAGHMRLQQALAESAQESGFYQRVGMGSIRLSEFSGLKHSPDIRPDVMGLTMEGRIDMIEILSAGQREGELVKKLEQAMKQLPPQMRGETRVFDPRAFK